MASLLMTLLVALLVAAIVWWIVSLLPLPVPVKNIVLAIFALLLLLWVLNTFGLFGARMKG